MYYGTKIFAAKNTPIERIYLYNNGDECVSVTGGWTIVGANITKNATNITFGAAATGTRRISTVNNINFSTFYRMYIKVRQSGATGASSFAVFKGVTPSNTTRLFNNINNSRGQIPQASIPNTDTFVMMYETVDFNDILSLANNFNTWVISEIYIDIYE